MFRLFHQCFRRSRSIRLRLEVGMSGQLRGKCILITGGAQGRDKIEHEKA
jgi:hypothetical protein